jgi:hypothetical protein
MGNKCTVEACKGLLSPREFNILGNTGYIRERPSDNFSDKIYHADWNGAKIVCERRLMHAKNCGRHTIKLIKKFLALNDIKFINDDFSYMEHLEKCLACKIRDSRD